MPQPGGESDKVGNRYELRWIVKCLLDILREEADAICLEPAGPRGYGAEFELRNGSEVQYHQVKTGAGLDGQWTLRRLHRDGVLQHMKTQLLNADARFVFVSGSNAGRLHELAEPAKGASDVTEFQGHSLSKELQEDFKLLCLLWDNWPQNDAFQALRRLDVKHIPEEALKIIIDSRAAMAIESDPGDACSTLAMLALDETEKRKTLTAYDIWEHLRSKGFPRRDWYNDACKVACVSEATERYVRRIRDLAIGGSPIRRSEATQIAELLTDSEGKSAVLVAGGAGAGKSGVLGQVVEIAAEQHWPVLAFRVDNLETTQLPKEIGRQLGLPLSPAHTLAAVAQGRNCMLVIDQLDAVSLASGRQPELWDCINEIIQQALVYPNMRLLLACRVFDLSNDRRLHSLIGDGGVADRLDVGRLEHEKVREVVKRLGLDPSKLTSKQLELLSVVLHLKLFAEIAEDGSPNPLGFVSPHDLYDRYWVYKQELIRLRIGRSVEWTQVIDKLADYMSEHQVLSAPKHVLDERPLPDVEAMVSEHILVEDDGKYAFFHEGFFDYAYARRFVARGDDLSALLHNSEQHLFRRAQVRQILTYERGVDRDRYISDLRMLLTGNAIRFHIRHAALGLLSSIPDPQPDEWDVLRSAMADAKNSCSPFITGVLRGSLGWFELLDSLGVWARWLASDDDRLVDSAVWLVWMVHKQASDPVAELLEPFVGASETWNNRLARLMDLAELSAGRRFFDLFIRLVDTGVLDRFDGSHQRDFWSLLPSLTEKRPEWACEAMDHYLARQLLLSHEANQVNPFDRHTGRLNSRGIEDCFNHCARGAPEAFVGHVLPFVISLVERNARTDEEQPWADDVWYYAPYLGGYSTEDQLLHGLIEAVSILAKDDEGAFDTIKSTLKGMPYETLELLLMRGYTANPAEYADEAAEYLCEDPGRLAVGYSDYPGGAAIELLKAITPCLLG